MLFLFIILHVAFSGDIKLYSQYDSLLQDKLLIVTKNGLIYNYDLKYQQIRWVSELGVSLQSDGIQNGTYYMRPYRDGSFLFYDDGFYVKEILTQKIEPEDIDLLFRTCSMFQNSLSYNNELMFFLDIATGNIKQLTQYDIQQLLSQPKLYEKGVLIQVQQKYISDLEFEDSQQHNSRIQINFLLKYLRGDKTQTLKLNSTYVEKRKYGIYIEWNNKTINLYLDHEVFEVFSYTPTQGLFSIFIDEEQNFSTGLTVSPIINPQSQCELLGECQPITSQHSQALGIYKPSEFQLCLNAFYKIKFQNQLILYESKQIEKNEQCEVVVHDNNNTNIVIIILLSIMLIAYLPIFKRSKNQIKTQKQKEIVIVKEPKVQYIYIKQNEIQIYKEKILGKGLNGTTVYEGVFQGKEVAVKEINLKNLNNKILEGKLEESINQQIQLTSPQIIKLYFFEKRNDFLYLAMEKCQLNLREFVKCDPNNKLNENQKKQIKLRLQDQQFFKECLKDFLLAIQIIMENKIIHHGLTPDNVLFNTEFKIKLADFGLSNIADYYSETQENKNQIKLKDYTIFQQLGLAFFFLLTRGDDQLYKHIIEDKIFEDRLKKNNIRELTVRDILKILLFNQEQISFASILNHPYFWSKQRKLSFICEFSDYVETFQLLPGQQTFQDRCIQNKVFQDNWGTKCELLLKCQIRGYDQTSAQQLVRLIRNTKNHYHQLTEESKLLLGPTDETCFDYWDSLFPNLFFSMYEHTITNKLNLLSLK